MNYNNLINNNLILNKYIVDDNNIEDNNNKYNINIYYIEDYLCKIIIIRNYDHNDHDDIKIKLFDFINNEEENISIGSLNIDYKIIEIYTKIKLIKSNMLYICDKKILLNEDLNNNYINLIFNNTNIEFVYYDNIYKREFIKNNYNKILELYDLYKDDNLKHIIFICIYIYINGGIYIHQNLKLLKSINDIGFENNIIIDKNNLLLLISDKKNEYIINYLDSLLYSKYIDYSNYNKNQINENIYSITAPINEYSIEKYNILNKIKDNIFLIEYSENKYLLEYLNLDYYLITCNEGEFENNFYVICLNNKNNFIKKIELHKDNKINCYNKFIFSLFLDIKT
jgi:hypothetical protein